MTSNLQSFNPFVAEVQQSLTNVVVVVVLSSVDVDVGGPRCPFHDDNAIYRIQKIQLITTQITITHVSYFRLPVRDILAL